MARYDGVDILALEAAAALQAGMSYGKWKAMGGKVEPTVDAPLVKGWQICKRCGKIFKPKKGVRQLFCNPDCQYEAAKEKQRAKYNARKLAMAAEEGK